MKHACIISALLAFGCGSSGGAQIFDGENLDGNSDPVFDAGSVAENGGAANLGSAGSVSEGGSENSTGDSAAEDAGSNSGGNNSGGNGPLGNDAGIGGQNIGGSGGGDIDGSQTSPCAPKDCLSMGIELSGGDITAEACGIVETNCSGIYINCGNNCNLQYGPAYSVCGKGVDQTGLVTSINPNLCGNLCSLINLAKFPSLTDSCTGIGELVTCNAPNGGAGTQIPTGCTDIAASGVKLPVGFFCCP